MLTFRHAARARAVTMTELLVVMLILGLLVLFVPYVAAKMVSSSQDVQGPTVLESIVPEVVAAAVSTPDGTLPADVVGRIEGPATVPVCADDGSGLLTDGSAACPTDVPAVWVGTTAGVGRVVATFQDDMSRCWAVSVGADGGQWWAASADSDWPPADCVPSQVTVPDTGTREAPATLP